MWDRREGEVQRKFWNGILKTGDGFEYLGVDVGQSYIVSSKM
jgi:hypothetical protein